MARALSTVKNAPHGTTQSSNQKWTLLSTNGYYFKTSDICPENIIIMIARSTKSSDVGAVIIRAGSTGGANDFEPGKYSTGRDLVVKIATSTAGSTKIHTIHISETARFKDTNGYIKIELSTGLGSPGLCRISAKYI